MSPRTERLESTVRSPLGAVLAELRDAPRAVRAPAGTATSGRQPDLRLETRVISDRQGASLLAVRWLLPASAVLHAALLLGVIVGPLLRADALPPATRTARAFLVAPAMPGPVPPPPPPRAAAARVARAARPEPAAVVRPVAVPEAPASVLPEPTDLDVRAAEPGVGEPTGEPGGMAGGVAGGVVGGVIGGLPDPTPPLAPVRVGGEIKEPAKVKHVPPVYPDIAVRSNVQGAVVLDCTISPQGRVAAVTIVRGIPLLDEAAVAAVRQWVYTPTLRDGVPVPIIMTVTVRFGLQERQRT